jgi:hypothetical protein
MIAAGAASATSSYCSDHYRSPGSRHSLGCAILDEDLSFDLAGSAGEFATARAHIAGCGTLTGVESVRAGQRYGKWTVAGDRRLGGGGNGEVWRAQTADGRVGAIKVLSARRGREGKYRLGRFRDEIAFLIAHPDFPGILPLLDSSICEDLDEPPWYVMPIARRIQQALGPDPTPGRVVGAVAEIAATLALLADEGVAHRDIKPDNLFELDGRWVVGDFGLVTYPDKDPRTEHGRRLGPVDYMPPEMRRDADRADPGPADVWALAKTLWVLLTSQKLPLPGTHWAAEAAHALRERITFRFAAELDLLLEKATLIEPKARVLMADMARELQACTASPPEDRPAAGLGELRARVAALTATSRQDYLQRADREGRNINARNELARVVADTAPELAELLTFDVHSRDSGSYAAALLEQPPFKPYSVHSTGWLLLPPGQLLLPPGQQPPAVEVIVATAYRLLHEDGPADIAALVRVNPLMRHDELHDGRDIWVRTYTGIPVASAQQATVVADIRSGITSCWPDTLRQVIHILSNPDAFH